MNEKHTAGQMTTTPLAQRIAVTAGLYGCVGGILSFAGWLTETNRLTDWWGTGISIKANTALAFIFAGLALLLIIGRPAARLTIYWLGAFVAAIGGLTLVEHLTGIDLGIDTLLFDEPAGAPATVAPGRMGPPASASFLALGIALALSRLDWRARRVSVGLALAVLAISTLALTGYLYGAPAMYTIPRLTGISLQTATMFAAMSIGLMAALPHHEPFATLSDESGSGKLARNLLLAAVAVPLGLGWLRIQGQKAGLYDYLFGASLRTVAEMLIFAGIVWWSVRTIRERDLARHRAETERRSTELRMEQALDAAAVPFWVIDPVRDGSGDIVDFTWTYVNSAAVRALHREGPVTARKTYRR